LLSQAAVTAALAVWLGVWLGVSVTLQFLPRQTRLRRSWLGWAFPEWRFFAPNPCTFDYALFYRKFDVPGSLERVRFDHRASFYWLWNPAARRQKTFRDLADALQQLTAESRDSDGVADAVCRSDPYILILGHCMSRMQDGGLAQFGIERLLPDEPDEIVFVSRWHTCQ
jgi:hypothetical protein